MEKNHNKAFDSDYNAALKRVIGLADFERSSSNPHHSSFHLERMTLLMNELDNPHLKIPTIHIAGTKGKGSTAAMITSILTNAGYKTGFYSSPHLHSILERIRVGLEPIAPNSFSGLVDQVWPTIEKVAKTSPYGEPTTFEMLTAMAFLHFSNEHMQFQVIEVGLGGRLDATNIVTPMLCIITPISLDHTSTLGNTIGSIAKEKAGIIKSKVPVVVAPQTQEAIDVFHHVASDKNCPLVRVDKKFSWEKTHSDLNGQTFTIRGMENVYHLQMSLLGDHQIENAATAIAAVESMSNMDCSIPERNVNEGILNTRWAGRCQILSYNGKTIIVDGAHNPAAMERLIQTIQQNCTFDKVVILLGALAGHNVKEMITKITQLNPIIIAVKSRHPRSLPKNMITKPARELGISLVYESNDVASGIKQAVDILGPNDLILGTGSLSVAAEIIEQVEGLTPEIYHNIRTGNNF